MTGLTDAMRSDFRVMKVSMGYDPHHRHHSIIILNSTNIPSSPPSSPPPTPSCRHHHFIIPVATTIVPITTIIILIITIIIFIITIIILFITIIILIITIIILIITIIILIITPIITPITVATKFTRCVSSGSRCSYESDSDAKRRMYEKVPGQCQFNPGSKFARQALPPPPVCSVNTYWPCFTTPV